MSNDLNQIAINELKKIRNSGRTTLNGIVHPAEIERVRYKLKAANIRFRTEKAYYCGQFIGYKVHLMF